jgi:hypothetical protein
MVRKLGELLVEAGAVEEAQLQAALDAQEDSGRPLGMTLVRMGFLDEITLIRTLANQLSMPLVRLQGKKIQAEILNTVPPDLAEKHRCLPLFIRSEDGSKALFLAMEDPADTEAVEDLGRLVEMRIRPVLVAPTELQEALARHYSWAPAGDDDVAFDPLGSIPTQSEDGLEVLDLGDGEDDLSDLSEPPAFGYSESPSAPGLATVRRADAVPADTILRALTQLLVEKGVITREELVERLGSIEDETGDEFD